MDYQTIDTSIADETASKRLKYWGCFSLFSGIALCTLYEASKDHDDDGGEVYLAKIVAIVSFALGPFFVLNAKWTDYTRTSNFLNGTIVELVTISILFLFWCVTLGLITIRDIGGGPEKSANLYYFSWGSFISIVFLWCDIFDARFHNPSDILVRHPRFSLWVLLAISDIITMSSSINIYNDDCADNGDHSDSYCNRTLFSVLFGVINFVFIAIFMIIQFQEGLQSNKFMQIECNASIALSIIYGILVGFLTSSSGPANSIGNLYYFSWIAFLTSFFIFVDCADKLSRPVYDRDEEQSLLASEVSNAELSNADDDNHSNSSISEFLKEGDDQTKSSVSALAREGDDQTKSSLSAFLQEDDQTDNKTTLSAYFKEQDENTSSLAAFIKDDDDID